MIQADMNAKQINAKYLRRAKIIASILSFAPYVWMIGLTGSLARGEATEKSDIDFFIVTKTNRLWTGRALVSILTHLSGYRRYDGKIAGRICLNCYQTEDRLIIGPKNIKNAKDYANIKILYQSHGLAKRFIEANRWISDKGYQFITARNTLRSLPQGCKRRYIASKGTPCAFGAGSFINIDPKAGGNIVASFLRWISEALYELILNNWGEKRLRSFQIRRILADPRTQIASQGQIYISDQELRFHPHTKTDENLD